MSDASGHDHIHLAPSQIGKPVDHSHDVAPASPHLHAHDGHVRAPFSEAAVPKAIHFKDVCAGYFGRDVLDAVTFDVLAGDFVGIIGPNGSGKTTLLRAIDGLLKVQCGAAAVLGSDPAAVDHRRVAYVPQIESVNWGFPVTVFDVVLMGRYGRLGLFKPPSKHDRRAVLDALEEVGMADRADSLIGQLSGGQQQRVFVARGLVQEPELMLLDEPIAGVDAASQHAIFTLLEERNRRGMTIVATTHDLSCVATWFDKVLCLNHRVIAYGPPSEVLNAQTLSATFGSHVLVLGADGRGAEVLP